MLGQRFGNLLRIRTLVVLGILILGAVLSLFRGGVEGLLAPACEHPPQLAPETSSEVAERLLALHELGLLYCAQVPNGIAGLGGELYWASDAVNSVLYVAAERASDLSLVGYLSDDLVIASPGGRPPARFSMPGRPTYRNQAPDGAAYFTIVMGPATASASSITVNLRGPADPTARSRGDFFSDLDAIWARFFGEPSEVGTRHVKVRFAVAADRWRPMTIETRYPPFDALEPSTYVGDVSVSKPTLFRTLVGPTGASVWLAGIVTGTLPSLALSGGAGSEVQPWYSQRWTDRVTGNSLTSFAFQPVAPGGRYSVLFWASDKQARGDPDATFGPVSFGALP